MEKGLCKKREKTASVGRSYPAPNQINFRGHKSSRFPHSRQIWNQRSHIFKYLYITQLSYERMFYLYRAAASNMCIHVNMTCLYHKWCLVFHKTSFSSALQQKSPVMQHKTSFSSAQSQDMSCSHDMSLSQDSSLSKLSRPPHGRQIWNQRSHIFQILIYYSTPVQINVLLVQSFFKCTITRHVMLTWHVFVCLFCLFHKTLLFHKTSLSSLYHMSRSWHVVFTRPLFQVHSDEEMSFFFTRPLFQVHHRCHFHIHIHHVYL